MLTYDQIGIILGVTRQRAQQLCKNGCPRTNGPDVVQWRRDHPNKHPGIGKREAEKKQREGFAYGPEICSPIENQVPLPEKTGDVLYDAVLGANTVVEQALRLVDESMHGKNPGALNMRLSTHSKALESMFKAQEAYREDLVSRGVLMNVRDAVMIYKPKLEKIVKRVNDLPQKRAPHLAGQPIDVCLKVLQEEVDSIIREADRMITECDRIMGVNHAA
jgi:hypothetical protein